MPKTKISEFSATPANNTDIDSINIAEGCAPSGINDAIRELMAQLKDFQTGAVGDSFNGPVGSSTAAAGAFTTLSASSTATLSGLTASTALALDASKNIVSVTNTGTGSNVLATSPTLVTPALGTPSALVGTNITGTAANFNINGTVGATTASTGAFTTLTTSSTVTHNGGTANGVTYLNGSKVLTSGSALTFDGTKLGVGITPVSTIHSYVADGGYVFGLSGTTKGLRVSTDSAQTLIQGVDNTLTGSYQPLTLGGSILVFQANGTTEGMRLTSTGLGIGTSSPDSKLNLTGTSTGSVALKITNNNATGADKYINMFAGGTSTGITSWNNSGVIESAVGANLVFSGYNGTILFQTGTSRTTQATLDSSGNLGLGVTPSAWASDKRVLQFDNGASIYANESVPAVYLGSNFYENSSGSPTYSTSTFASQYYQYNGQHVWRTAASGTAGNAITFTQAMTLDASGNLLVGGTTSPSGKANNFVNLGGSGGFWTKSGGVGYFGTLDNYAMILSTNDTERARIDSSGNLLVGTTTNTFAATNGFVVNGPAGGTYAAVCHPTGTGSGASYMIFSYNGTLIGNITQSGTTAVLYNTTSDQRLKENIANADSASSLIDALQVRQFDWKSDNSHQRYGFVAQELVTVAPEAVYQPEDTEQMMAVDYSKLVPMLVKEIQSLRQRVAQLETN